MIIVLNPPVSFPTIVNNALTVLVKSACGFAFKTNLLPVRVIDLPLVATLVVSSSIKLVAALAKSVFPDGATPPRGALSTPPSDATSNVATVSSLRIAVYPFVSFAPCSH